MKNKFSKLAVLALSGAMAFSAAACGENVNNEEESGVCEVKAVIAGYGVDWLTEASAAFNEAFKDEGYEIKIVLTDTSINMLNEIQYPKRNSTDLYFEYNQINTLVNKSRNVFKNNTECIFEDLTDVLNSKPIGSDKKEQGKTLMECIPEEVISGYKYTGKLQGFNGYYGLPLTGGTNGVYVNEKTLLEKGYSFDDFLTTDSVIKMVKELQPADETDASAFYPVAFSGQKAPGYWRYLYTTLLAQYAGAQKYNDMWTFTPASGNQIADGYTVYEERGILEALKVIEELENRDYSVPGTSSMDHIGAQARVFTGRSLFMVSGDWIYKEMEKDYSDYLNDVVKVRTPVISALGVKLGLCGSSHAEGDSCATCETKLKTAVKAADEGKAAAAIATEAGISEAQATTIREARGYYEGIDTSWSITIPSYANAKKAAKMFIRFLMSDEGQAIYNKNTYSFMAFSTDIDSSAMDKKSKAMYDFMYSDISSAYYADANNPIRVFNGLSNNLFPGYGTESSIFMALSYSHKNEKNPAMTAQKVYDTCKNDVRKNWNDYLVTAGLIEG